jgi:hypothetical protein
MAPFDCVTTSKRRVRAAYGPVARPEPIGRVIIFSLSIAIYCSILLLMDVELISTMCKSRWFKKLLLIPNFPPVVQRICFTGSEFTTIKTLLLGSEESLE